MVTCGNLSLANTDTFGTVHLSTEEATMTEEPSSDAAEPARAIFLVNGRVQGVGFRWWTRSRALELGLVGHARNLSDGRVDVDAQGKPAALDRLEQLLREEPSSHGRPGRVDGVLRWDESPREGVDGFHER